MNETPAHNAYTASIVGVFRTQEQANNAVSALKDAHFEAEQVSVTTYGEAQTEASRVIVHVNTPDRGPEAVGLLTHHGANNSDLPSGMQLANGSVIPNDTQASSAQLQKPDVEQPDLSVLREETEHRVR